MTIEKMPVISALTNHYTPTHTASTSPLSSNEGCKVQDKMTRAANVTLSARSSTLTCDETDIDSQKVVRLQHAIASGSYHIDCHKIADSLIHHAQEENYGK